MERIGKFRAILGEVASANIAGQNGGIGLTPEVGVAVWSWLLEAGPSRLPGAQVAVGKPGQNWPFR